MKHEEDRGRATAALSMAVLTVVMLIVLLVTLGCSAPSAPSTSHTYVLRSVDGATLPAPGLFDFLIEAGTVELRENATYVDVLRIGGTLDSLRGTWRLEGDSVKFQPERASMAPYAGALSAASLTVMWAEGVFRYTR